MNIAHYLEQAAQRDPEHPALVFGADTWSYRALDLAASAWATRLQARGTKAGDRVAVVLPNVPAYLTSYYGALKLGAVVVSINPEFTESELERLMLDAEPIVIVTDERTAQKIKGVDEGRLIIAPSLESEGPATAAVARQGSDLAAIVYTSGTTSQKQGVMLSHANIDFNSVSKVNYLGLTRADRLLLFLPLFHCFGQNAIMNAAVRAGATLILHRGFEFEAILHSVHANRVTQFFGVPYVFSLLLAAAEPHQLSGVRYFFSAAAPLRETLELEWRAKFPHPIHQGYGLTETSPFASYNHRDQVRVGSVGVAIDGVQIKVFESRGGREAAPLTKGEIAIKGPNVMLGYWRNPEETKRVIRDGWFFTGDVAYKDDEGYIHLVDRIKDLINVAGMKVYPAEVEHILCQHPNVSAAAVFGVEDALMGEQVHAAVVPRKSVSVSAEDLTAYCRSRMAAYKVPIFLRVVDGLPMNPAGKVLKRILREAANNARSGSSLDQGQPVGVGRAPGPKPALSAKTIELWIMDWISGHLGQVALDPEQTFVNIGLNSSSMVAIITKLGDELGLKINVTSAWSYPTPSTLAQFLAEPKPETSLAAAVDLIEVTSNSAEKLGVGFGDKPDLLVAAVTPTHPLLEEEDILKLIDRELRAR